MSSCWPGQVPVCQAVRDQGCPGWGGIWSGPSLGAAPICPVLIGAFILFQSIIFPLFTSLLILIPHSLTQTSPTPGSSELARRKKSLRGEQSPRTPRKVPSVYFSSPCPAQAWALPLSRGSLSHQLWAPCLQSCPLQHLYHQVWHSRPLSGYL